MPSEVSWLVEKRILYIHMYGFMTGQEIAAQNKIMETYIQQSEQLLHLISDSTDMTGTNMGLRDLQKMQFANVPNLGWSIYISSRMMDRFFASVITQLMKKRGREFATLEQGLHFLQEMDDTLPQIPMPNLLNVT
jgi:hypothetical protein